MGVMEGGGLGEMAGGRAGEGGGGRRGGGGGGGGEGKGEVEWFPHTCFFRVLCLPNHLLLL